MSPSEESPSWKPSVPHSRRLKVGDAVMVSEQAPEEELRNRRCVITQIDPRGIEARVRFDDSLRPTIAKVRCHSLAL
jgi:hypothetical protein